MDEDQECGVSAVLDEDLRIRCQQASRHDGLHSAKLGTKAGYGPGLDVDVVVTITWS